MKNIAIILILLSTHFVYAQDAQFSQFTASPLNLNPALTGNSPCDWRLVLNARNQWIGVANGNTYLTGSISGDVAIGKIKNKKTNFGGVGLLINGDKSGSLNMMSTDILANGAYHFVMGKAGLSTLSFGLQMGIKIKSVDNSLMTLPDDVDRVTGAIVPSHSAVVTNPTIINPDASFGAMFSSRPSTKVNYYVGTGFFHLTQTKYSFTGGNDNRKYFKFSGHGGVNIDVKQVSFMPSTIWMYENGSVQYSIGSYFKYKLTKETKTNNKPMAVYIGGWYKDIKAVTVAARFEYDGLNVGVSYDFNMSSLGTLNSAGAPELSIVYTGCLKRNPNKFGCPVVF